MRSFHKKNLRTLQEDIDSEEKMNIDLRTGYIS